METLTKENTTNSYFTYKQKSFYIVLGIILYVGGIASYPLIEKSVLNRPLKTKAPISDTRTYEDGFNAAKKLIDESGVISLLIQNSKRNNYQGTVTSINGNRISFHDSSIKNPFETIIRDYTAVLNEKTSVLKAVYSTSTSTATKASQDNICGALPMSRVGALSTDIKIGDFIIVTSANEAKNSAEFVANNVLIQGPMVTP